MCVWAPAPYCSRALRTRTSHDNKEARNIFSSVRSPLQKAPSKAAQHHPPLGALSKVSNLNIAVICLMKIDSGRARYFLFRFAGARGGRERWNEMTRAAETMQIWQLSGRWQRCEIDERIIAFGRVQAAFGEIFSCSRRIRRTMGAWVACSNREHLSLMPGIVYTKMQNEFVQFAKKIIKLFNWKLHLNKIIFSNNRHWILIL